MPWSIRYNALSENGDFNKFFSLLRARLRDLFLFNEASIPNLLHFGTRIASESLRRFPYDNDIGLPPQIFVYFDYAKFSEVANRRTEQDPEAQAVQDLSLADKYSGAFDKAKHIEASTRITRYMGHLNLLIAERLEVLQSILVLLSQSQINNILPGLVRDIRRFAADSCIFLDIKGSPPTVVPIEEPLLQKEVIDKLLPRLEAKYPARAADLVTAYQYLATPSKHWKNLHDKLAERQHLK